MDIKEYNKKIKEAEELKDMINLEINLEKEKYLLKLFMSKDDRSIVIILQREKIKTYYYYGKFYLNEFIKMNKIFISDNNINSVFIHLKEITQNYICSLEKKSLKMKISFTNNSLEIVSIFILRKKIVEQNRMNMQLIEEIHENKSKIKLLKKQLSKLDKIIQNKNNLIEDINSNIGKISNDVNNLNNNIKNNYGNNKNNDNKINKKEEKLLKKNLLTKKYKKDEFDKDKRYKIDIFPKDNEYNLNQNENNNIFNLDNIEVLKNRKVFEALITFNTITIIIIIYLLISISDLKSGFIFRVREHGLLKKMAIINLLDNYEEDEIRGIRDNIIDFQIKNNNNDDVEDINNDDKIPKKKMSYIIKTNSKNFKYISLLNNEREKRFFRKHIKRRTRSRIRDIDLVLKYNSLNPEIFSDIFSNLRVIPEILILMKNKEGKRYGLFTNNIFLIDKDIDDIRSEYAGYEFRDGKIIEINLKIFYDNYVEYIQNIYNYFKNEKLNLMNNNRNDSFKLLGDIKLFEIYEVKYIK